MLSYPDYNELFEIYTDMSTRQLGAVITQKGKVPSYGAVITQKGKVLAYFS